MSCKDCVACVDDDDAEFIDVIEIDDDSGPVDLSEGGVADEFEDGGYIFIDEDVPVAKPAGTIEPSAGQLPRGGSGAGASSGGGRSNAASSGSSLVDPEFETLDPTPDVRALFAQYDKEFFGGALASVALEWSKRMTQCAGICYYRGAGGVIIRLSEPLLQYRPRSDLVNTVRSQ